MLWKKYKKELLLVTAAMILSVLCAVQMADLAQYEYGGTGSLVQEDGAGVRAVYENISLSPGVYEVRLQYQTDSDMKNLCTVKSQEASSGKLLTNGEHLYQGRTQTDFLMWLFAPVSDIAVTVEYGGQGYVQTADLLIQETPQLWTILLTLIWTGTAALMAVFWYLRCNKEGRFSREQKLTYFWLAVIVLAASLPYLRRECISGADLTYHLQRIEGVKDGLLSGQFPVRLEPEWLYGHGYANGIFYCNTLLFFPAVLRLLGFTVTASYHGFCIFLNILTALIAYYCFKRIFKSNTIGLLCTALHTLSIYRIYKLVMVGAVGEGSAITFLPLLLYGLYRIFSEEPEQASYKSAWVPLALGAAGLIQSHVLTCEITLFLAILICLANLRKVFRLRTFLELLKGAGAAAALSLWYLVPFLDYYINEDMHIRHVAARTIQERGLYPAQLAFQFWKMGGNAMDNMEGMQNSQPMGVGLLLFSCFFLFLIKWFSGKWSKKTEAVISLGKYAAVIGGMLMVMSLECFPWDRIQQMNGVFAALVSSIQFPNRFLSWGTVCLITVFGCLLWNLKMEGKRKEYIVGGILSVVMLVTSSLYLQDHIIKEENRFQLYNAEGMGVGYISGAEYLVEGTKEELLTYRGPVCSEGVSLSYYEKEYLTVQMICVNEGEGEGYVELPMLHYTGYQAQDADTGEMLLVEKGNNNVVRVVLPEGFLGTVSVKFISPVSWRVSEAVSLASWTGLLALSIVWIRKRKQVVV